MGSFVAYLYYRRTFDRSFPIRFVGQTPKPIATLSRLDKSQVDLIRVFACFDLDRDKDLLPRLVDEGKQRGAKFTVFDCSAREIPSQEAMDRLRQRMTNVDAVVVLCGEWTHRAHNVNAELKLAQELGKRYYLLKGRRNIECAKPATARLDDKLYVWNGGALNELVFRFH